MALHDEVLLDLHQHHRSGATEGVEPLLQDLCDCESGDAGGAMRRKNGAELLVSVIQTLAGSGSSPISGQDRVRVMETALRALLTFSLTDVALREEVARAGGVDFLITLISRLNQHDESLHGVLRYSLALLQCLSVTPSLAHHFHSAGEERGAAGGERGGGERVRQLLTRVRETHPDERCKEQARLTIECLGKPAHVPVVSTGPAQPKRTRLEIPSQAQSLQRLLLDLNNQTDVVEELRYLTRLRLRDLSRLLTSSCTPVTASETASDLEEACRRGDAAGLFSRLLTTIWPAGVCLSDEDMSDLTLTLTTMLTLTLTCPSVAEAMVEKDVASLILQRLNPLRLTVRPQERVLRSLRASLALLVSLRPHLRPRELTLLTTLLTNPTLTTDPLTAALTATLTSDTLTGGEMGTVPVIMNAVQGDQDSKMATLDEISTLLRQLQNETQSVSACLRTLETLVRATKPRLPVSPDVSRALTGAFMRAHGPATLLKLMTSQPSSTPVVQESLQLLLNFSALHSDLADEMEPQMFRFLAELLKKNSDGDRIRRGKLLPLQLILSLLWNLARGSSPLGAGLAAVGGVVGGVAARLGHAPTALLGAGAAWRLGVASRSPVAAAHLCDLLVRGEVMMDGTRVALLLGKDEGIEEQEEEGASGRVSGERQSDAHQLTLGIAELGQMLSALAQGCAERSPASRMEEEAGQEHYVIPMEPMEVEDEESPLVIAKTGGRMKKLIQKLFSCVLSCTQSDGDENGYRPVEHSGKKGGASACCCVGGGDEDGIPRKALQYWTTDDVSDWLIENRLTSLSNPLKGKDGKWLQRILGEGQDHVVSLLSTSGGDKGWKSDLASFLNLLSRLG